MSVVLTRSVGEAICIGDDIIVTVVDVRSHAVRLAIASPRDVRVDRLEVRLAKQAQLTDRDDKPDNVVDVDDEEPAPP
jgi:carbon storage regulator CsrA